MEEVSTDVADGNGRTGGGHHQAKSQRTGDDQSSNDNLKAASDSKATTPWLPPTPSSILAPVLASPLPLPSPGAHPSSRRGSETAAFESLPPPFQSVSSSGGKCDRPPHETSTTSKYDPANTASAVSSVKHLLNGQSDGWEGARRGSGRALPRHHLEKNAGGGGSGGDVRLPSFQNLFQDHGRMEKGEEGGRRSEGFGLGYGYHSVTGESSPPFPYTPYSDSLVDNQEDSPMMSPPSIPLLRSRSSYNSANASVAAPNTNKRKRPSTTPSSGSTSPNNTFNNPSHQHPFARNLPRHPSPFSLDAFSGHSSHPHAQSVAPYSSSYDQTRSRSASTSLSNTSPAGPIPISEYNLPSPVPMDGGTMLPPPKFATFASQAPLNNPQDSNSRSVYNTYQASGSSARIQSREVVQPEQSPTAAATATTPQQSARKISHSLIERRRREKINDCLTKLRLAVPQCREQAEKRSNPKSSSSANADGAGTEKSGAKGGKAGRGKKKAQANDNDEKNDADGSNAAGGGGKGVSMHKLEILLGTIEYIEELEAKVEMYKRECVCGIIEKDAKSNETKDDAGGGGGEGEGEGEGGDGDGAGNLGGDAKGKHGEGDEPRQSGADGGKTSGVRKTGEIVGKGRSTNPKRQLVSDPPSVPLVPESQSMPQHEQPQTVMNDDSSAPTSTVAGGAQSGTASSFGLGQRHRPGSRFERAFQAQTEHPDLPSPSKRQRLRGASISSVYVSTAPPTNRTDDDLGVSSPATAPMSKPRHTDPGTPSPDEDSGSGTLTPASQLPPRSDSSAAISDSMDSKSTRPRVPLLPGSNSTPRQADGYFTSAIEPGFKMSAVSKDEDDAAALLLSFASPDLRAVRIS